MDNLPPGVSASSIPGNTREDAEWEAFLDWAYDQLSNLPVTEGRRAVLMGIAAVNAERDEIRTAVAERVIEERLRELESRPVEEPNEERLPW